MEPAYTLGPLNKKKTTTINNRSLANVDLETLRKSLNHATANSAREKQ